MLAPTPRAIWRRARGRVAVRRVAGFSAGLAAVGATALAGLARPDRATTPRISPPAVEWTGCAAELAGPICEVTGDRPLTVWVADQIGADGARCGVEVRIDGRVVRAPGEAVQGGRRLRVPVDRGDRALSVSACGPASFALALRPRELPAVLDQVNRERAAAPADALARLRAAEPGLPARFRAAAAGLEARILAATRGVDAAEPAFARAVELAARDGRVSDGCSARLALAYFRREHLRLGGAHAVLDAGAACAEASPTQRALWPYYHAIASLEEPDLRAAAGMLELAVARQERLGMDAELALSRQQQGRVLALFGRFEEAAAVLARAVASTDGCERALVANELGWTALQAAEAGRPIRAPGAIEVDLEAGLAAADRCGPPWRTRPLLLLNLAFAHVAAGRAAAAADALARARIAWQGDDALARPWWLELEGEVARVRGRSAAAEAAFRELDALGAARLDDHVRWRAALGLARALEQRGDRAGAIAAYRAAEDSVDRELRLVPFGEGRASFAEARSPGTGRLLALLVADGRAAEAAEVARRSLQRGVRNLLRASQLLALDAPTHARWRELVGRYRQERRRLEQDAGASWRLPAAELPERRRRALEVDRELRRILDDRLRDDGVGAALRAPSAGELVLVYHPTDGDEWIGLAIEADRVEARRLGAIDEERAASGARRPSPMAAADAARLSAALLEPFGPALRRARAISIVAPASLAALDVHALPFDGRPLLAVRPVAYSLDLGPTPGPVPAPRTALIARDASGELPGAAREAEQVAAALPGSTALRAADLTGLAGAIERAEHFHYAGHGRAAGPDGLESALLVSEELRLSSADVLTLRRVPDTVVLSGCDLARGAGGRASVSLGVAQAFAARGSRAVAAPVRPVRDEDAAAFARLLYATLPLAPSFQAAVADAQLALRAERPGADWAAFRVLGP